MASSTAVVIRDAARKQRAAPVEPNAAEHLEARRNVSSVLVRLTACG